MSRLTPPPPPSRPQASSKIPQGSTTGGAGVAMALARATSSPRINLPSCVSPLPKPGANRSPHLWLQASLRVSMAPRRPSSTLRSSCSTRAQRKCRWASQASFCSRRPRAMPTRARQVPRVSGRKIVGLVTTLKKRSSWTSRLPRNSTCKSLRHRKL